MNFKAVLFVLGNLALILSCTLVAPLAVSLIYESGGAHEEREVLSFGVTILVALLLGGGLRILFKGSELRVQVREGFAIVTLSWILFSVLGMLPYLITGVASGVTDAFFETMSGFTTTGATIFPRVEVLPHGVQFWRCMTQWLGGMGIVVLSVALLPLLGVGGYRILKAETPGGVAFERDRPRITDSAKDMWMLYVVFSLIEVFLLALGGMTPFDAICHTFTTMSTGGFSPHSESIAHFNGPLLQWILIVFMIIAGTNFSIHAHFLRGRVKLALRNTEFLLYLSLICAAVLMGVVAQADERGVEHQIREMAFAVVSVFTTTGFATADFDLWLPFSKFILIILMFIGGCMGSTAGGIKVFRVIVFAKTVTRELHRMLFPHALRPLRIGNKVVDPHVGANIMAFGSLYTGAFVLGIGVMVFCGYDLVSAVTASVASLSNIGPGLGKVGPTQNWAHLPIMAKWVMSGLMLLGRLELFSVVVLFTPWLWRR